MCGIFFSLSSTEFVHPEEDTQRIVRNRGPDSYRAHHACVSCPTPSGGDEQCDGDADCKRYLTFISSVLALRGDHVEAQPLVDPSSQSVLCWNGEAWKISNEIISGNDTHRVFQLFLESVRPSEDPTRSYACEDPLPRLAHASAPIPPMNKCLPDTTPRAPSPLVTSSPSVLELENLLRQSLELRVQAVPDPPSLSAGAKVAVLFSGGLDCTILARLAHELLPEDEPIDLLNVAFENPRVAAANLAKNGNQTSVFEDCPDRKTGRSSYAELRRICPTRPWRFVCINIPYAETTQHRDKVRRLMRPHNTEMDLSITCALYFASRGVGEVTPDDDSGVPAPYTTAARVLLSGLGADEVFAGYQRHALAFARQGFQGLVDEIDLDVGRLGKRNLGRDDRVLSNWGREARYPYLDEDFSQMGPSTSVWEKCGFGIASNGAESAGGDGVVECPEEPELEPGKKALRLVAWNLGMNLVAKEKKRAIQFGSRTAKMESGRSKGTQVLS
ncbi:asparagine synthetase domain- containing protein 1 [Coccidioides immitis RMSCC 3703]|uniref:Asparagine synthetase domain-containing protein 1 n=1 Tax=Coccidioides immitis RMSCC 3703 TaxID=454286 RepID=A0A0J8R181_COCIT|nr:asparagine synthetase domain- containing protein 1 [Coccidioides immitis RMSCC 3703]